MMIHRCESGSSTDGGRALRLLIAEDELLLAYAMRGQLETRGVNVVGLAIDGDTALTRCLELRPDVVLMDVRMPRTDGVAATRLVMRECPTCIIVVTAFADDEARAKAEAAGAMGFLSKPIQAAGVLEEIPKARARFAEFGLLRAESRDLEETLATRALVEVAKEHLLTTGVAEAGGAFAVLMDMAQRSGASLRAIAARLVGGTVGAG
jgi:two-component system, response regulator PdtaR